MSGGWGASKDVAIGTGVRNRSRAWLRPTIGSIVRVRLHPDGERVLRDNVMEGLASPPHSVTALWTRKGFPRAVKERNRAYLPLAALAWIENHLGIIFEFDDDTA